MTLKTRILLNAFTASFAAVLLQRGLYFFTHDLLGFNQAQNLWFALLFGVAYVGGASASHSVATRLGERRALLTVLLLLALVHVGLASFPSALVLTVAFALMALLQGAMWPIFESYMSAGETPQSLGRALSRYNIAWALSVPPALALAGPLIASGSPRWLFVVAAALYALIWLSCRTFPARPAHLDAGHAARPDAAVLVRFRALLIAARFAMLESYMLLFLLAPLMPEIMKSVGFGTAAAARASSLLDVARLGCFIGLFAYSGWHGKKSPIALAIASLPLGFALVLFGQSVAVVVAGELLFGAAAGFLYTAALYYAQVVQNASVDAGGAHEALIGIGYALGPGAGLVGTALAGGAGPGSAAYVRGMSVATLPLIVVCSAGALWPLLRRR
ncbi:MAG TPA: MFS transporter [Polyangiaceae bacterium]|nr:MFS transporter [Polyangiaceae bacterium]